MSTYEIGTEINTKDGDYKILKCIRPPLIDPDTNIQEGIALYEVVDHDGNYEVLVRENASCWILGDEKNAERNREQFGTVRRSESCFWYWDEIENDNLRARIKDLDNNARESDVLKISVALSSLREEAGYLCALVDQGYEIDDRTAHGIKDVVRRQLERIECAVWGPAGEPRLDPNCIFVKMFRKNGIELCKKKEVAE